MKRFRLNEALIDAPALHARLADPRSGAWLAFEGRVRDSHVGRPVLGLRYDAYRVLAEREGERILAEAMTRFGLRQTLAEHRVGELVVGDLAVWVGVAAGHRDAAYAASRWIIDAIKADVPIWKHERYADGEAAWLHPMSDAGEAARRDAADQPAVPRCGGEGVHGRSISVRPQGSLDTLPAAQGRSQEGESDQA